MAADVRNAQGSNDANDSLQQQLFRAFATSEVASVKDLLAKGADPNAPCALGTCPLQVASSNGTVPVVRALLEVGCKTQWAVSGSQEVQSAACLAAAAGWVSVLEVLHELDPASISEASRGGGAEQSWTTPLYQAALHRQPACLQFLLCHHAMWYPPETIRLLFEKGVPPDPSVNPVCAAALSGDLPVVRELLQLGGAVQGAASAFALRGEIGGMMEVLEMCLPELSLQEAEGALRGAVQGGHTDLVVHLLQTFPVENIVTPQALSTVAEAAVSEHGAELWTRCVSAVLSLRDPTLCYAALLASVSRTVQPQVVVALLAAGVKPDRGVWQAAVRSQHSPWKAGVLAVLKRHMGVMQWQG